METFKNTFSDILQAEKQNIRSFTVKIQDGLLEDGIQMTRRTIEKYVSGERVPTYNTAKSILKFLDVSMPEETLLEVLEYSKEFKKQDSVERLVIPDRKVKTETPALRKRISIKYNEFSFLDGSNVPKEDAIDLINERVSEQYGNDQFAFNRYIKDLIDKDMKS